MQLCFYQNKLIYSLIKTKLNIFCVEIKKTEIHLFLHKTFFKPNLQNQKEKL